MRERHGWRAMSPSVIQDFDYGYPTDESVNNYKDEEDNY